MANPEEIDYPASPAFWNDDHLYAMLHQRAENPAIADLTDKAEKIMLSLARLEAPYHGRYSLPAEIVGETTERLGRTINLNDSRRVANDNEPAATQSLAERLHTTLEQYTDGGEATQTP